MTVYEDLVKTLREQEQYITRDLWAKPLLSAAADAVEVLENTVKFLDGKADGEWIAHEDDWWGNYWECSACHDEFNIIEGDMYYKYCPNCGAKMKV